MLPDLAAALRDPTVGWDFRPLCLVLFSWSLFLSVSFFLASSTRFGAGGMPLSTSPAAAGRPAFVGRLSRPTGSFAPQQKLIVHRTIFLHPKQFTQKMSQCPI